MYPARVDSKSAFADDQRKRNGIQPQDQWPLLRNDVKQRVEAGGLHSGKDGLMNRRDCARMAASKRDQILIGLFDRHTAGTKPFNRVILEGDYPGHGLRMSQAKVNF